MALNQFVYTEQIARSFLCDQLTAYCFEDERQLARTWPLPSLGGKAVGNE